MNHGFVKIAAAVPHLRVADCVYNTERIKEMMVRADREEVQIICFPELSLTSYSCGDLFMQQKLLDASIDSLDELLRFSAGYDTIAIVGMPLSYTNILLNVAVVLQRGKLLGVVPKVYLPTYKEFYEQRWFNSGTHIPECEITLCGQRVTLSSQMVFDTPAVSFGVEICEDVWAPAPPSTRHALQGAEIIFNQSASNEVMGKHRMASNLVRQQSARCLAGYVYTSSGFGESTTDVVFGGNAMIFESGELLAQSERFSMEEQMLISDIDVERLRMERRTNTTFAANLNNLNVRYTHVAAAPVRWKESHVDRRINPAPFIPQGEVRDEQHEEILNIQTMGLVSRMVHTRCEHLVVGISGGLDSTLALLVSVRAMDKLKLPHSNVLGITMPGFGTTGRTLNNALMMMQQLGVTCKEISIKEACLQHFKDIEQDLDKHDATYENAQARERTQILMDMANKVGGLVVGTGDLSELALGWATYNGDHMSMYSVNASIPKTLVQSLIEWISERCNPTLSDCLKDVVKTPISPELTPAGKEGEIKQKTEELVGPYELHDFFLFHFMLYGSRPAKIYYLARMAFEGKYSDQTLKHWLKSFYRRFFSQQFKRSCLPDGPKATPVSLSPRGDWRMPSDAVAALWLQECEKL